MGAEYTAPSEHGETQYGQNPTPEYGMGFVIDPETTPETLITPGKPLNLYEGPHETPATGQGHQTEHVFIPRVGHVATIAQKGAKLAFSAHDLATLIRDQNPAKALVRLPEATNVAYVPDRPDIVLRWNPVPYGKLIPAKSPEELIIYMEHYERELDRLEACGIPILRHSTHVVAHDNYFGTPGVYMAVERLSDERDLSAAGAYNLDDPQVREIHRQTCRALTKYFTTTPPGGLFIYESITMANQFSRDGIPFDYDPYMTNDEAVRQAELGFVADWERAIDFGMAGGGNVKW